VSVLKSILCRLGIHTWKKYAFAQFKMLNEGFSGIRYQTSATVLYCQCQECGKRDTLYHSGDKTILNVHPEVSLSALKWIETGKAPEYSQLLTPPSTIEKATQ